MTAHKSAVIFFSKFDILFYLQYQNAKAFAIFVSLKLKVIHQK